MSASARAEAGTLSRSLGEARLCLLGRLHREAILAYALRRLGDRVEAEEFVAETFRIARRRLAEIPIDSRARLWLYAAAHRVLVGRHPARCTGPARGITGPRGRNGGLDLRDHELLLLVSAERLSPAQAGRVVGLSPFAARRRLRRARRLKRAPDGR